MSRRSSVDWERAIDNFIADFAPQALHVHDLPLLGAALKVANNKDIPVVADLHENYPAMLEETLKVPLHKIVSLGSLASRLSVSVPRWKAYEADVVPRASRIIVVVEEARDRLLDLGVPEDIVHVVGNYATLDDSGQQEPEPAAVHRTDRRLRVVYAGGFGPTRDLVTVLDAIKALPEQIRSGFDVKLIGGQGRDIEQLRRHAATLQIEEHVTLLQWLPRPEAEQLMTEADVGLVPHVKSAHTDATVPHKLFQYMWRRLPVIVSSCAPLERIVNDAGCGLVYRSGDSSDLAFCLTSIRENPERAAAMGNAGHDAVGRKYSWEHAGAELLSVYRDLK
jgi:glycosyltransferase involved in cell wall biosynthesis